MWLTCVTWLCKKEKLRNFITFDRSCDQSSLSFLLGRKKAFFIQIPFDTSRAYREINIMRHKNEIDWVDKKAHSSQLVENIYIHALATINYFPPNSMVMFGVIFWFTFHLIWKYYVLHWVILLFFGMFVPVCLEESGMSCGNKSRPSLGLDLCIWRSDGKGSKVDWKWRIKFWPFYFWRPYQKCSFVGLCLLIQSTKILLYGKTLKEKTQSLIYICTIIYERLSKADFFPFFVWLKFLSCLKTKYL